ncbi:MAG: NrfD/PsrC family molybdoenzyme membrane anchor subunit [Anaerolineae bacterium]|nr:NrfD/PsrC family molybdoenzyme membrane anchor subunit [Anaerolineae bacterium]
MHGWGWLPAIYLFLGGVGAGALIIAAAFEFLITRSEDEFCPTVLVGATLPGPLVILGTILLIFDLGAGLREPWRIPYMFTHFTSVMTWGVWLLTFFIPVSLVYGFLEVLDSFPAARDWLRARQWLGWTRFLWNLPLRRTKRVFAGVGAVLAVGVGTYTGLLLSAVGPAIPFWSTPAFPNLHIPLLPLLFLVSAISTGEALTVDLAATLFVDGRIPRGRRVHLIHLAVITAEALLISHLLIHAFGEGGAAAASAWEIALGRHSLVFWIFIILLAIIFPFVGHLYAAGLGRHLMPSGISSGISILLSGLFLRYLILVSGIHAFL